METIATCGNCAVFVYTLCVCTLSHRCDVCHGQHKATIELWDAASECALPPARGQPAPTAFHSNVHARSVCSSMHAARSPTPTLRPTCQQRDREYQRGQQAASHRQRYLRRARRYRHHINKQISIITKSRLVYNYRRPANLPRVFLSYATHGTRYGTGRGLGPVQILQAGVL